MTNKSYLRSVYNFIRLFNLSMLHVTIKNIRRVAKGIYFGAVVEAAVTVSHPISFKVFLKLREFTGAKLGRYDDWVVLPHSFSQQDNNSHVVSRAVCLQSTRSFVKECSNSWTARFNAFDKKFTTTNASSHSMPIISELLIEVNVIVLPHTPFRPVLKPTNFILFNRD